MISYISYFVSGLLVHGTLIDNNIRNMVFMKGFMQISET